jgi:glutaryl-CoA dehydrogenase (non-decarboxylating)
LLIERAAWLKNAGMPSAQATSLAKWTAAAVAYDAAEAALAIQQAFSSPPHHTIERHLQNIKGSVIYGGTAEIHQIMQADYALGHRVERPFRRPSPTAADLRG